MWRNIFCHAVLHLHLPYPHPCSEREAAAFAVKGLPVDPATGKPLPRGPTVPVPFKLATEALHRHDDDGHGDEGGGEHGVGLGSGGGSHAHPKRHRDGRRGSSVSAAFVGGGRGAPAAAPGLQLDGGMDVTAAGLVSAY